MQDEWSQFVEKTKTYRKSLEYFFVSIEVY